MNTMGQDIVAAPVHSDEITVGELSRVLGGVLGERGIASLAALVEWFEDGRRHLLEDVDEAARQLGTTRSFLATVVATRAFRRAYFNHLLSRSFDPDVLSDGFRLLAQDFISPETPTKQRLAIMKTLAEHAGIAKVEKVEHEVKGGQINVAFVLAAQPDDFVDAPVVTAQPALEASAPGGSLVPDLQGDAGHGSEEIIEAEIEEADGGEA